MVLEVQLSQACTQRLPPPFPWVSLIPTTLYDSSHIATDGTWGSIASQSHRSIKAKNTQHTTQQRGLVQRVVWCVFSLITPKSAKFGALDAGGTWGGGGGRGERGELTPYGPWPNFPAVRKF